MTRRISWDRSWRGIALVVLLATGLASGKSRDRDLPDQTIETPTGKILISGLRYDHLLGTSLLKFAVTNQTGRDLVGVTIGYSVTDKDGDVVNRSKLPSEADEIILGEFAKGQTITKKIQRSDKADKPSAALHFRYISGSYDAVYRFALIEPAAETMAFEDAQTAWAFEPNTKGVQLLLLNKSSSPMRLDLDRSSIVDFAGIAHPVATGNMRFIEVGHQRAPIVIPQGSKLSDVVFPAENAEPGKVQVMLPSCPKCQDYLDKKVALLLHVSGDGIEKDYSFSFKVTRVE